MTHATLLVHQPPGRPRAGVTGVAARQALQICANGHVGWKDTRKTTATDGQPPMLRIART